jgi:hypothetical protein
MRPCQRRADGGHAEMALPRIKLDLTADERVVPSLVIAPVTYPK